MRKSENMLSDRECKDSWQQMRIEKRMTRRNENNMSLKIDHIIKKFGNFTALNDISLEIKDGEFLAILGPSGCGKTTLLRIIGGFEAPTEGSILKDGEIFSSRVRMFRWNREISAWYSSPSPSGRI